MKPRKNMRHFFDYTERKRIAAEMRKLVATWDEHSPQAILGTERGRSRVMKTKESASALAVLTELIERHGCGVISWENFGVLLQEKGIATSQITRPLIRRAKEAAANRLEALLTEPPKDLKWEGPIRMETPISRSQIWLTSCSRYRILRRKMIYTGEVEYLVEYRRMTQGKDGSPIWDFILENEGRNGYYPKLFKNQDAAFEAAAHHARTKNVHIPRERAALPEPAKKEPRPSNGARPGCDEFGARIGSNQEKIHSALTNKFQSMKELTEAAGLPGKTFYSHLTKLADAGLIERSKEGFRRKK